MLDLASLGGAFRVDIIDQEVRVVYVKNDSLAEFRSSLGEVVKVRSREAMNLRQSARGLDLSPLRASFIQEHLIPQVLFIGLVFKRPLASSRGLAIRGSVVEAQVDGRIVVIAHRGNVPKSKASYGLGIRFRV